MASPAPVCRVSGSGRVTRVAPSFAYISSSTYGGIFVPPCAVLPPERADPVVTNYLQSGDIVHFTANKQPVAKNGWEYVATKVTVSPNHGAVSEDALLSSFNENSDALSVGNGENVLENMQGVICQVNETYAFVYCQAIDSTVFFPGSAYKSDTQDEPARLNAHFHAGDMVSLNARKQTPKNGCEYLALRVNKIEKTGEGKEEGQIDTRKSTASTAGVDRVTQKFPSTEMIRLSDYSLVSLQALDITDEDSISDALSRIDTAIQYGEDADVKDRYPEEVDFEDANGGNGMIH